jgi:hypothetical protein
MGWPPGVVSCGANGIAGAHAAVACAKHINEATRNQPPPPPSPGHPVDQLHTPIARPILPLCLLTHAATQARMCLQRPTTAAASTTAASGVVQLQQGRIARQQAAA